MIQRLRVRLEGTTDSSTIAREELLSVDASHDPRRGYGSTREVKRVESGGLRRVMQLGLPPGPRMRTRRWEVSTG